MKKIFFLTIFFLTAFFSKAQSLVWMNETKMKGKIGSDEVVITLAIPFGGATDFLTMGEYYYVGKNKKIDLCSTDEEKIYECVNGEETKNYFIFYDWDKKVGQTVTGTYYSWTNKKSYPFTLKVIGKKD